jgi:putative membrane protein
MIRILIPAASALALLAACGQNDDQMAQDPVNAVQDATSAAVGQTSAATLGANTVEGYVTNAAIGDMYEIQAAEIALERSQNAQVRELAQMIHDDHTAASQRMQSIVQGGDVEAELPTELDERRQGMIDNLRDAENFDQVYIDQQVAAHQEALTLHRGFDDNEDAPELAAHAQQVTGPIEMHLERARALDE